MRTLFKIALLLVASFSFYSLNGQSGPSGDISEQIKIKRERTFKGEALYGFMNGGSELYLEYGFKDLRAIDISFRGNDYTVEIYKMAGPEEAFGIYSIHTFGMLYADTLFEISCHSMMQLQTVAGDTYYSLVFETPSKEVNSDAVELIKYYIERAENQGEFELPSEINEFVTSVSGNLKLMMGPLGVMAGSSELIDLLKNVSNYKLWVFKDENSATSKALFYTKDENSIAHLKSLLASSALVLQGKGLLLFDF